MQKDNSFYKLENYKRKKLTTPNGEKKLLLHSCCAVCGGEIMEAIKHSSINFSIFFYNPNIHPKKEYELRKKENISFAEKLDIPFIDVDYDDFNWFERTKGMENEVERGKRCTVCFDMRLERSALYAYENGFDLIATTLGISRWKDINQVNNAGFRAVKPYNINYWDFNWRKQGGSQRTIAIAKREKLHRQEYCGCIYSIRDTNKFRINNNRKKIKIGEKVS